MGDFPELSLDRGTNNCCCLRFRARETETSQNTGDSAIRQEGAIPGTGRAAPGSRRFIQTRRGGAQPSAGAGGPRRGQEAASRAESEEQAEGNAALECERVGEGEGARDDGRIGGR